MSLQQLFKHSYPVLRFKALMGENGLSNLKNYRDLKLEYENMLKVKLKGDKETPFRNKSRVFSRKRLMQTSETFLWRGISDKYSKTFDTLCVPVNSTEIRLSASQMCDSVFSAGRAVARLPRPPQECRSVSSFLEKSGHVRARGDSVVFLAGLVCLDVYPKLIAITADWCIKAALFMRG